MTSALQKQVQSQAKLMTTVNEFVYNHPELGYEEIQCADYLTESLRELGLEVERPIAGIETAFRATLPGEAGGPRVGLVMLYDAVPMVQSDGTYHPNHSCGHNVISAAVIGAVAALARQAIRRGDLVVMGLPGDEIGAPQVMCRGGSKAVTAIEGVWDDLDAVLYAHPEFYNTVSQASRWMARYQVDITHARQLDQRGELQASVVWVVHELLGAIRTLESDHTQEFVMVKRAWINGDVEASCPVSAQLQILVFGLSQDEVETRSIALTEAVNSIGRSAEIPIVLERIGPLYMGIRPNARLATVVHDAMEAVGLEVLFDPLPLPFATDFGNITQRLPSALIGIGRKGGWKFHSLEEAKEFTSETANQVMRETAEVLAVATTYLWENPDWIVRIHNEHQKYVTDGRILNA